MDAFIGAAYAAATTVANGFVAAVSVFFSPGTLSVIVILLSLTWLSGIELEELTRQGTKPDVQLH